MTDTKLEPYAAMRAFVLAGTDVMWQGGSWDGGDMQDLALSLGLIVKHPEPFNHEKHGPVTGSDFLENGDDWYVLAPWLQKVGP